MYTGKDIKDIRKKFNLSINEFAKKIKKPDGKPLTPNTIRNWEKNEEKPIPEKYNENIEGLFSKEKQHFENEEKVKNGFFKKIKETLADIEFVEDAVAMYFMTIDPKVDTVDKAIAYAALTYFILPLDAIPDFVPGVGFIDDAAMIAGAIIQLGKIISETHRIQARAWLQDKNYKNI